jgi:putative transposase
LAGKKTGKNPTDRGKLGVKRSVLTDALGVVLGLVIAGANVHDVNLALPTLNSMPIRRPQLAPRRKQHLCMDKAYDSNDLRRRVRRRHIVPHVKTRGEEVEEHRCHPHAKARRWVNERTQSWFNRFRRILIRWEKKAENYLAELEFVAAWIAFRAAGVFG